MASKAAFLGKHEGWGQVWGAALGTEPHTVLVARLAPQLWSEQSGTLETVTFGFTAKMNGRRPGGLQKRILRLTKSLKNQLIVAAKLLKVCE